MFCLALSPVLPCALGSGYILRFREADSLMDEFIVFEYVSTCVSISVS